MANVSTAAFTVDDGRPAPIIHATRLPGPDARMPNTSFTFTRSYLVKFTSLNALMTRAAEWLVDVDHADFVKGEPNHLAIHLTGLGFTLDALEREFS